MPALSSLGVRQAVTIHDAASATKLTSWWLSFLSAVCCLFSFPDTNDCNVNNGNCEQICRNIPGGKECACRTGYQLNLDRQTCSGKNISLA